MTKKEIARARSKKWYRDHIAYVKIRDKKYAEEHKDAIRSYQKRWQQENAERKLEKDREYRKKNADRLRAYHSEYQANRMKNDLGYRFNRTLRLRARQALKVNGTVKSDKFNVLMGASITEVRKYIEVRFLPGMTWENWGLRGWHVDHKRPLASFDLRSPLQQKIAFHYTNLQPLWASENIKKGARV